MYGFFSHICVYTDFSHFMLDVPYRFIQNVLGQCIVTMFLFYSGYGIMESVKSKGQKYIQQFPVHRIFRVLLLFDCAILLYMIYGKLVGVEYSAKTLFLTFLGWESIGNSNWYIFCVLWLYIFTYFAFLICQMDYMKFAITIFVLSTIYIIVMCNPELGKASWWYDTILCYFYGVCFSLYRCKIETLINKSFKSWMFYFSIVIIGFIVASFYLNIFFVYQLRVFCFVAVIVIFTMRYVIDSRILRWLGENLFELYILQRLPMLFFKPYIQKSMISKYIYVLICFIATVILAILYRQTISRVIEILTTRHFRLSGLLKGKRGL